LESNSIGILSLKTITGKQFLNGMNTTMIDPEIEERVKHWAGVLDDESPQGQNQALYQYIGRVEHQMSMMQAQIASMNESWLKAESIRYAEWVTFRDRFIRSSLLILGMVGFAATMVIITSHG
jgi:predicted transcriptional regulator